MHVHSIARRLAYFWLVWSGLLLVHELGHVLALTRQGELVQRVTVGLGPKLWQGEYHNTEAVLRLVPLAGLTTISRHADRTSRLTRSADWAWWRREAVALVAGVVATLAFAVVMAGLVAARERWTSSRWSLGRYVIADAVVLTVLNLLPVPPLDGGHALVNAVSAMRGESLSSDALFWLHAGGFALAVIPMAFWTRWTRPIDVAAARWGAPAQH